MLLIIAASILLLAVLPLALSAPVVTLAVAAGAIGVWWLCRQGLWRAAYGLVIVTMLGAISSVEQWVAVSQYGRLVAVGALLTVTYTTTRQQAPVPLRRTAQWVLTCLSLLALVAVVSAVWSVGIVDTLTQAALLIALVLILRRLVTRRWADRATMVGDFRVGAVISSATMAVGLAAHFAGLLPPTFSGRFQGLFNNPNLAAIVAVLVLFVCWGLFMESRSFRMILLAIPALLTVALTETRAAFLAAVIGVVWIALRSGTRTFLVTVLAIGAFTVFGQALWQPVVARFGQTAAGDAFAGRTIGWSTALQLFAERPVGYGWGTTQRVFSEAYQSGVSGFAPESVHNSYLQLLLEVNIVGAALLVLLLAGMGVMLFQRRPAGIEVGLSAAVIAGLVVQFSESAMFGMGQAYPWIFWFAVAGLLASPPGREKPQSAEVAQPLTRRARAGR